MDITSKEAMELHNKILEIIMENSFLNRENEWSVKEMETRAIYDSFRIIELLK